MSIPRLAIFASGSGSNAEEIMKYFNSKGTAEVVALLSNTSEAYALVRAQKYGVLTHVFDRHTFYHTQEVSNYLNKLGVTHVILAGFLWLVPAYLIAHFPSRILNIHPALLPRFGGKGMYGMKVHEAVKQSGEAETGITIHEVNEKYDEGAVVFQARVPVLANDSPEDIATKVHALEYEHFPRVIEKWLGVH